MIDGIVLSSYSDYLRQRIHTSPLLADTLCNHTAIKTGANYVTASYNDLKFKICSSGRVEIKGSVHKYFNCINGSFIGKERHNSNDFKLGDIKHVLNSLAASFGEDILYCKIDAIEFGLNIKTPCTASFFIEQNITLLKFGPRLKNPITENDIYGHKRGIKYIFCDYWLKCYDKGAMYGIATDLLRLEYKAIKMRALKGSGLSKFSDISDLHALEFLFSNLIEVYNHLLIREEFNENEFSVNDRNMYHQGYNPDYWQSINKKVRDKKKKQFERLYNDHAITNLKSEILQLLKDKFDELT